MEEWLRSKKREVKKKDGEDEDEMFKNPTPANFEARKKISAMNKAPLEDGIKQRLAEAGTRADVKAILEEVKARRTADEVGENKNEVDDKPAKRAKTKPTKEKKATPAKKKNAKSAPTPSLSDVDEEDDEDLSMPDLSNEERDEVDRKIMTAAPTKISGRSRESEGKEDELCRSRCGE